MTILKEAKYNAKWRRPECPPGPGDKVSCCGDVFKVVTVIQRPDEGNFKVADLEVVPISYIEPVIHWAYEQEAFYVVLVK
jgi:hypothetical protein